jgi:Tol biopolymer transport system component
MLDAVVLMLIFAGEAPPAPSTALPPNLRGGVFESVVQQMWRSSPTFRRQCARVAGAPRLTITVRGEPPRSGSSIRAYTRISDKRGGVTAQVVILNPSDAIELIAHELEHIVEYLDGVEPGRDACGGRQPRQPGKPYETCRAIHAGQQVVREIAEAARTRVEARRQEDMLSGPLDPPSARVSADGRFVVFTSAARLLPGARGGRDLYVHDVQTGSLQLASARPGWADRYVDFRHPGISKDGRRLVFDARTSAEHRTDAFGWEVVVLDRETATSRVIHLDVDGRPATRNSTPVISADGRTVAFESVGTTRGGDASALYVARLHSGPIERVDVPNAQGSDGPPAWQHARTHLQGKSMTPTISADGRYVAFASTRELTRNGPAARQNHGRERKWVTIYVRDTTEGVTTAIVRSTHGREPNGPSYRPAISADGRYVAFTSEASNLVSADQNGAADVFVHDRLTETTELVSRRPTGRSGNGASRNPFLSGDGSMVAFQSLASDLICHRRCGPDQRDINLLWDIFLFDRRTGAMMRASAGPEGEWMTASRSPALDHTGRVLVFSSRHPVDDEDVRNDDDLYIQVRGCGTQALPHAEHPSGHLCQGR